MGHFITEDWFGYGTITEEDIEVLRKFANVLSYSVGEMEEDDMFAANEKIKSDFVKEKI